MTKNPRGYETLHTVHKKRVVGTQTNLWSQWNITCFNCWSTNIPAPILHVKLKFEIGHSTCGTLLNKRRQALLTEQQQQSFNNCILPIFPPYCYAMQRTNDVVFSFVWTGLRYTLSKLSDSAAIQWINSYILLCNAMITITLVEWNSECVSSAYPTFVQLGPELCSSRKYPYSPHGRDWKFLGVFSKAQIHVFTKCMKLDWNFQRGEGWGGGGSKEKSLPWGEVRIVFGTTQTQAWA